LSLAHLGYLPEWTFDRKRFSENSIPNLKAQKPFRENETTSFFGQVSRLIRPLAEENFVIYIIVQAIFAQKMNGYVREKG